MFIVCIEKAQGSEREVVLISNVRSNSYHGIGFVLSAKRLNVGITRAKRGLILIRYCAVVSCMPE